ncbi:MAG TPA: ferritin-like domain-containing protein [Bryobacteraceae bacterium]|nr:ferritin-like domain-containing protein [Bryobacteraceae bacterium]
MPNPSVLPNSAELIRQYLKETIGAEETLEEQLRSFASEGDDEDVQLAFAEHADETRVHRERLRERLSSVGGGDLAEAGVLAPVLDLRPKFARAGNTLEERLVQNLFTAFTAEKSECAMYEVLATVAHAAGDSATEVVAREIEAENQRAAEKFFHFLPTRSKIAFNILTAEEIDPAIVTKVADNRLI